MLLEVRNLSLDDKIINAARGTVAPRHRGVVSEISHNPDGASITLRFNSDVYPKLQSEELRILVPTNPKNPPQIIVATMIWSGAKAAITHTWEIHQHHGRSEK